MAKTKYIGLVAIIPAVVGLMIGMGIDFSEAQVGFSFGGPVIDIEEEDQVSAGGEYPGDMPTLTLNSINKFRPSTQGTGAITHTVAYTVTAGNANLQNITIEVASDIEEEDYQVGALSALKSAKNVARIKALDADSIVIEITGYRITAPTGSGIDRGPSAEQ